MLDREGIGKSFDNVLGDQIRRSRKMRLGNPLTREVKVSLDDADSPGRYYVHGVGGDNLANADDDTENKQTVTQAVMSPGLISDDYLIYGTTVEVVRKNGLLHITGFDGILANEYLNDVKIRPQRSIDISQFDFGLIRPTSPAASMQVLVTGARYVLNGQAYDVPTRQSASFVSYKPADAGMAVAVKIELDPVTASLYYEAGEDEFSDTLSHAAAFGFYPVTVTEDRFLCGWVKVKNSQQSIAIADIYHAPELLNKTSLTSGVLSGIRLQEQEAEPAAPDAGFQVIYVTEDGLFVINSDDVVTGPMTTTHNDLDGLTTGDPHTQYLPLTGSRAMTGNLFMADNLIVSEEITTPSAAPEFMRALYAKDDGWYDMDDEGVETQLGGSGGGEATHGALVTNTGTYTLSTTPGYIPFENETYDTDDFHDDMTDTERLTIPTGMGGLYHINAQVDISSDYEAGAVGPVQVAIILNGSDTIASDAFWYDDSFGNNASKNMSVDWPLVATDYVRVRITKGYGNPAFTGSGTDMYISGWLSLRRLPALYEA